MGWSNYYSGKNGAKFTEKVFGDLTFFSVSPFYSNLEMLFFSEGRLQPVVTGISLPFSLILTLAVTLPIGLASLALWFIVAAPIFSMVYGVSRSVQESVNNAL